MGPYWKKTKTSVVILFLLIGGVNHYFIILFSYWFSITTIKNAIATQQKKYSIANPFLFL